MVIAIQTPLNTFLGISYEPAKKVGKVNGKYVEPAKDLYHLEIDAETGRNGLPDEKITIYSVEAPDHIKANSKQIKGKAEDKHGEDISLSSKK